MAGKATSPATEPSPGQAGRGTLDPSAPPPLPPQRPLAGDNVGEPSAGSLTGTEPNGAVEDARPVKPPFVALVGLDANELMREMGAPAEVRIQSPATIWEYRFSGCRLALFLFRDVNNQLLKALSFETAGLEIDTTVGRDERCPEPIAENVADG